MCGIFALLLNRPLTDADIERGRRGTLALRHRGPDASGEWIDRAAGVYIGHRRLSIIDPSSASDQPMVRGQCVLAFNGEIYNFRELRRELSDRRDVLTTTGDTEVLLASWQRWGEDCVDHFDGMFAFLVWDRALGAATLAVDPFGEKPLLWAETEEGIYVASEIGPLADTIGEAPHLTDEQIAAYFSLGYLPAPATAYPSIRRLPRASTLRVEGGRVRDRRRYWEPPVGERARGHVRPLSEADLDRIHDAIAKSLDGRLVADVPLGAFLSAGIDSPLVVAIAAKELGTRLNCLTISFSGDDEMNDEAPQAARIAEAIGVKHRVLTISADKIRTDVHGLLHLYREPTENIGIFPVHQLSRAAAAEYKVVMTGMGGDEVSWGYGKHEYFYRQRWLYRLPEWLRMLAGGFCRFGAIVEPRAANFQRLFAVRDWERYLAQKNDPALDWLRRLPGFANWARQTFQHPGIPVEFAVPRFELSEAMPNAQLICNDLGSMRASVELRTPFLSRDLVETFASFDPRALLAFGQKSVLRRLLSRYLPNELIYQPKSGLRFPVGRFLDGQHLQLATVPGVPDAMVEEAWRRRGEGKGWARLAVGLVVASVFFSQEEAARANIGRDSVASWS